MQLEALAAVLQRPRAHVVEDGILAVLNAQPDDVRRAVEVIVGAASKRTRAA